MPPSSTVDIMNDPAYTPKNSTGSAPSEPDHCRICRSEGSPEEPLYHPCKCSGSIKFVHQDCLMEWLQHSQKKYCELCKTPFTFTKVYDPAMPTRLPTPLFLRQLARHFGRNIVTWLRGILVAVVWLGWLPWCVRWMWRGWFWMSDGGWWALQASITHKDTTATVPTAEEPSPIQTSAAGGGRGILGFLSSPALSALMSPVNGGTTPPALAPNASLLQNATVISPAYPGGIFFEHNPFETLTQWPTLNRAIVDVLEGQLLTALIVVSFIIIFLIREWVVQQQPGGDGEDFDGLLIDDAPQADVDDADQENPDEEELVPAGEDVADEELLNRAFGPVLGDLEIEDVNGEPIAAELIRPRRLARPRRRRVFGAEENETVGDGNGTVDNPAESSEDSVSSGMATTVPVRPALTREATSQASNFRRDLEETHMRSGGTPSLDFGGTGGSTENLFQFGGNSNAEFSGPKFIDTYTDLPGPSRGSHHSSEHMENSPGSDPSLNNSTSTPGSLASSEDLKPPVPPRNIGESPARNNENSIWGSGSFEMIFAPPEQNAHSPSEGKGKEKEHTDTNDATEKDGSVWESEEEEEADKQAEDSRPGPSEWSTTAQRGDTSIASTSSSSLPDDSSRAELNQDPILPIESTVGDNLLDDDAMNETIRNVAPHRNIPEERLRATFNHLGGGGNHIAENVAQRPDPAPEDRGNLWDWVNGEMGPIADPPQPRPEPQIDAPPVVEPVINNDVPLALPDDDVLAALGGGNAAPMIPDDDAADEFEGIMELVGMRGPIMGLIQNAAISSMLITATVAIGVAFPYVVGKTVMMILAHPILFFFRFPMAAVSFGAEFIVDSATMTAFSMLLMVDQAIRFFIKPMSFLAPGLAKIAASSKVTNFLKDWAADGHNRVVEKFTSVETTYAAFRRYPPSAVPPVSVVAQDAWGRFSASCLSFLHKVGLGAVTTAKLNTGPEEISLVGMKIPNPAVWAANAWSDTFSTVNFTRSVANSKLSSKVMREAVVADGIAVPLYKWSAWDRVAVVLLGYMFFTFVGMLYVRRRRIAGITRDIERNAVEFLEQCGGVMKVVLIIGIEMFLFPLYCGTLLDIAMLPLFAEANIAQRVQFAIDNPITSIFVHWFVGTCYMFHFALFVSMCRKIMRTGVLYFIRDPDDPTFHPVRDVLDRPVVMQLRKIAFSGFIYGILVLLCLGSVVWGLRACSDHILPIHWASHEPILEFPIDLLFYNFLVPVAVKFFKPSDGLQAMYGWWFQQCARLLRLTSFMFGDRQPDEEGYHHYPTWTAYFRSFFTGEKGDPHMPVRPTDTPPVGKVYFKQTGRFVRAPASDSLRRPKGSAVFIPVDENNRRTDVDASMDPPDGPTGSLSPDWKMVYIPPYFRVRVAMVVLGIWIFAAITGVFATVGPLLLGRVVLRNAIPQQVAVNDIYAFSVGIYIFGGLAIVLAKASVAKAWIQDTVVHLLAAANKSRTQAASNALKIGVLRAAKLAYLAVTVGVIIPALIALVIEFYLVIPVHTIFLPSFLVSPYPYPGSSAYDESLPPTSTGGPADASPVPSSAMANTTRSPLPTPSPYPFPSQYHSPHTLHFVQDWTLGVLYLKMLFRLMLLNENSTPARTLRRVFPDDDYFNPDIVLATRVLIAPIMGGMLAALLIPFGMARGIVAILGLENMDAGSEVAGMGLSVDEMKVLIYRLAFPGLMAIMAVGGCAWIGLKVVEKWRGMVRDEMYLRGVRVHNHGERLKAPVAEGELINAPQVVAEVDDAVLNAAAVRGNGDRARL